MCWESWWHLSYENQYPPEHILTVLIGAWLCFVIISVVLFWWFFQVDFIGIILYCIGWGILTLNQVLIAVLYGGETGVCSLGNLYMVWLTVQMSPCILLVSDSVVKLEEERDLL